MREDGRVLKGDNRWNALMAVVRRRMFMSSYNILALAEDLGIVKDVGLVC